MSEEFKSKGIVYLNGDFIQADEAKISVFDSAFVHGDSVQEFTRTFNGKLFRLDDHLNRLFMSLKSARIELDISIDELKKITIKVLDMNQKIYGTGDGGWIVHLVSTGILDKWREKNIKYKNNTTTIFYRSFSFELLAKNYKKGVHVITASTRRVAPASIDTKMKQCSRMDLNIASREVKCIDEEAYAILLDQFGNISEGDGQNIFIVNDKGILQTPCGKNIMKGISRDVVIELAKELKIPVEETDIQPYDLYNAREAFLTATSFCIFPVTKFNFVNIGNGKLGVIAGKLLDAWSKMVGVDIFKQAEENSGKKFFN